MVQWGCPNVLKGPHATNPSCQDVWCVKVVQGSQHLRLQCQLWSPKCMVRRVEGGAAECNYEGEVWRTKQCDGTMTRLFQVGSTDDTGRGPWQAPGRPTWSGKPRAPQLVGYVGLSPQLVGHVGLPLNLWGVSVRLLYLGGLCELPCMSQSPQSNKAPAWFRPECWASTCSVRVPDVGTKV